MPYDLCGPAGDFFFNDSSWTKVLALAHIFGWKPAGTLSPVDEHGTLLYDNWEGSYELFVHQRVSAEDAAHLADALDQAPRDIPDHGAAEHKAVPVELGGVPGWAYAPDDINPIEWFSGERGRQYLQEFIAFCRKGEFSICCKKGRE